MKKLFSFLSLCAIALSAIAAEPQIPWRNLSAIPSPTLTLGGDATGNVTFLSGSGATLNLTFANTAVTAGTYRSVTVDAKGRVTGGTNPLTLTSVNSVAAAASSDLSLTAGSGNQGVSVSGTGTGATASALNTGGLRSLNFGLSTVSGGPNYWGGDMSLIPGNFRATGSLASFLLWKDSTPTKAARFQFGTLADDGATIGVYDGSSWNDAIRIAPTSGKVTIPGSFAQGSASAAGNVAAGFKIGVGPQVSVYSNTASDMAATSAVGVSSYGAAKLFGFDLGNNGRGIWGNSSDGNTYVTAGTGATISFGTLSAGPATNAVATYGGLGNWGASGLNIVATTQAVSPSTGAVKIGSLAGSDYVNLGGGNIFMGGFLTTGTGALFRSTSTVIPVTIQDNGNTAVGGSLSFDTNAGTSVWRAGLRDGGGALGAAGELFFSNLNGSWTTWFSLNNAGVATFSGKLIGKGTATNDNAATGYIGEYVSSTIASGSGVALAVDGTTYNVTSISLSAGDWDVQAIAGFNMTSATVTQFVAGLSTNSGTLPTEARLVAHPSALSSATGTFTPVIPPLRFSLSAPTVVYLVNRLAFSAGTITGYGTISARRVR